MKVLLDECVDSRLAERIRGHTVVTAAARGWAGVTSGELLRLAQAEIDVFVTVDLRQARPAFQNRPVNDCASTLIGG